MIYENQLRSNHLPTPHSPLQSKPTGGSIRNKEKKTGFLETKSSCFAILSFFSYKFLKGREVANCILQGTYRSNCSMNTRLINLFICQSALPARMKAFRTRALPHSISEFPVSTTLETQAGALQLVLSLTQLSTLECLCCDARF